MTTAEILNAAADYIEKYGHVTGRYGGNFHGTREDGPACLSGAMRSVARDRISEHWLALDALHRHLGENPLSWNDRHDRTADEVISALRAAARSCE
jgi:hypothetical protein